MTTTSPQKWRALVRAVSEPLKRAHDSIGVARERLESLAVERQSDRETVDRLVEELANLRAGIESAFGDLEAIKEGR